MITIACSLWDHNEASYPFSVYDETWVEKLYRGCKRNLTRPFRFVCFSEREREYLEPIEQERLSAPKPDYNACLEPFRLDEPMVIIGLDTIMTGNIDHIADYALAEDARLAVPRDPFKPETVCNGIMVVPKGHAWVWEAGQGANDMGTMRFLWERGHVNVTDEMWPGHVVSYKGHVRKHGVGDARIVYFHGPHKPQEVAWNEPWIGEHWV